MTDTISKDDEREARKWLSNWADSRAAAGREYALTVLALLDRKVLPRPEEVPEELLVKMYSAWLGAREGDDVLDFRAAYRVLYDHYNPLPKPKKVEAWAVRWPDGSFTAYTSETDARRHERSENRIVRLVEATDEQ